MTHRSLAITLSALFLLSPMALAGVVAYAPPALAANGSAGGTTGGFGGGSAGGTTANNGGGSNQSIENPLGAGTNLQTFLLDILSIITDYIGPIVIILMLVYVGFLFVTAQGNETQITKAKEALMWTIVGGLILLGAKAIALGIGATVQALSGP